MSDLESNKAFAAILTAGIAFSVAGVIGGYAVHPVELKKTVLDIKEAAPAGAAAPEAPKPLAPIAPLLVSADVGAGEADTKKLCVSCHNFNEGGANKTGPDLYGVLGRPVASHEGFDYSAALKGHQGPWTYAELNEWLHSPRGYAPGTKMGFAGIENDKERANVIAYLRSLAANPEPLPPVEAAPAAATPAAAAMPAAMPAGGAAKAPDAPAKGDSAGTKANAPVSSDAPTTGVTRPQAAPVNGAAGQANAPGQQMTQPSSNQNIPQALQSESQQNPAAHPVGPAEDTVPASQQVGHPVASPTPASTTTPVGVPDGHANAQTPEARTDGDTTQQTDRSQGTNGGAPGK